MSRLVYFEGLILLGGFFGLIAWRLCTGQMKLDYLLYVKRTGASGLPQSFSPGRAQMLFVTLLAAGSYLIQIVNDPRRFPEIPTSWIIVLAGSHSIYLGGKAHSVLTTFRNLTDRSNDNEKQ